MNYTKITQSLSSFLSQTPKDESYARITSCTPKEYKDTVADIEHVCVTNNQLFQYLFGVDKNKPLTIALLNSFVEEELQQKIVDIKPCNQELPPEVPEFNGLHYELTCYLEDGSFIKTAFQLCKNGLAEIAFTFWAWIYKHQIKDESEIERLRPCISFNILDYRYSDLSDKLHTTATLANSENYEPLSKDMSVHFVQIPVLKISDHMSKQEKWAAFLSDKLTLSQKEEIAKDEPLILQAIAEVKEYISNEKNVRSYLASKKLAQEQIQEIDQDDSLCIKIKVKRNCQPKK